MADPQATPVVPVTIIGTGDGTLPVSGMSSLTDGTPAVTPDHQPNLVIKVVTPAMAILVRFLNGYLTVMVGLVAAGMTSNLIPAVDFYHLLLACAKLSLAGPALGALKDCVTIFGRLEQKFPLMTGSV